MGGCTSTPVTPVRKARQESSEEDQQKTPPTSRCDGKTTSPPAATAGTPSDGSKSSQAEPANPFTSERPVAFDISIVPHGDSVTSERGVFVCPPRVTPETSGSSGSASRWSIARTGGGYSTPRSGLWSDECSPLGSPAQDVFPSPTAARHPTPRPQAGPGRAPPPPLPLWSAITEQDPPSLELSDPVAICPPVPTLESSDEAEGRLQLLLPATGGSSYLTSPNVRRVPSLTRSSTEGSLKGRSLEGGGPSSGSALGAQQQEVAWVEYDALDEVRCPSVGGRSVPEQPADFWLRYLMQHGATSWEERCNREAQREELRAMNDHLIRVQTAALAARGGVVGPSPLQGPSLDSPSPCGGAPPAPVDGAVSQWIDETLFTN